MKRQIKIFISYSHNNQTMANNFIEKFSEYIKPSKIYDYVVWRDVDINVGDLWEVKILTNLKECDCGLLLISPSFLNSTFIKEKELPALLGGGKIVIPVALTKINFEHHDLHGLEHTQIFRLSDASFKMPRSFTELKEKRREDFIDELFCQMENRLQEHFK